jgi:hypothetical protein
MDVLLRATAIPPCIRFAILIVVFTLFVAIILNNVVIVKPGWWARS